MAVITSRDDFVILLLREVKNWGHRSLGRVTPTLLFSLSFPPFSFASSLPSALWRKPNGEVTWSGYVRLWYKLLVLYWLSPPFPSFLFLLLLSFPSFFLRYNGSPLVTRDEVTLGYFTCHWNWQSPLFPSSFLPFPPFLLPFLTSALQRKPNGEERLGYVVPQITEIGILHLFLPYFLLLPSLLLLYECSQLVR